MTTSLTPGSQRSGRAAQRAWWAGPRGWALVLTIAVGGAALLLWDRQPEAQVQTPERPAPVSGTAVTVTNPADRRQKVGSWTPADAATVERALANAVAAQPGWNATPAADRAAILEKAAGLLEAQTAKYMALCTAEAGKSLADGIAEVREAVDFLRYYAMQAREKFADVALPGPTGESNVLQLHGRGVFVCISPWNFPLAIFLGQVAAALAGLFL